MTRPHIFRFGGRWHVHFEGSCASTLYLGCLEWVARQNGWLVRGTLS
jgi:hypothetical protein